MADIDKGPTREHQAYALLRVFSICSCVTFPFVIRPGGVWKNRLHIDKEVYEIWRARASGLVLENTGITCVLIIRIYATIVLL